MHLQVVATLQTERHLAAEHIVEPLPHAAESGKSAEVGRGAQSSNLETWWRGGTQKLTGKKRQSKTRAIHTRHAPTSTTAAVSVSEQGLVCEEQSGGSRHEESLGSGFPHIFGDRAYGNDDSPPVVSRLERSGGKLIRLESVVPRADNDQVRLEVLTIGANTR